MVTECKSKVTITNIMCKAKVFYVVVCLKPHVGHNSNHSCLELSLVIPIFMLSSVSKCPFGPNKVDKTT